MKRIILALCLLIPSLALAQETRTQATASLMALGMPAQLATQVAGLSTGLGVISNNVWLRWRNAGGTADISAFRVNSAGQTEINSDGNALVIKNNGTDNVYLFPTTGLSLLASGQTIHIQEATAGSKCMGSVTYNGTTAVTVSTTCASTGARIFLTPTSDPTGSTAAYCWATNIVNGVSFDVDCDQANDGTANWLIIKEAA